MTSSHLFHYYPALTHSACQFFRRKVAKCSTHFKLAIILATYFVLLLKSSYFWNSRHDSGVAMYLLSYTEDL